MFIPWVVTFFHFSPPAFVVCILYVYKYVCNCVMHPNMNIIQSDAWKEHTLQVQYVNAALQGAPVYFISTFVLVIILNHESKIDFQCNFIQNYTSNGSLPSTLQITGNYT